MGPFLLFFEDGEETAYLGVLLFDLGVLLFDALVEELDLGAEDIGAVGILLAVVDCIANIIVAIDKSLIIVGKMVEACSKHIPLPCHQPTTINFRKYR